MFENDGLFSKFDNLDCGCDEDCCDCSGTEKVCRHITYQQTDEEKKWFTPEQRWRIIGEACWAGEGDYDAKELEELSDYELAGIWIESLSSYASYIIATS